MSNGFVNRIKAAMIVTLPIALMAIVHGQNSTQTWGYPSITKIPNDGSIYTALAATECSQFAIKEDGTVVAGTVYEDLDYTEMPKGLKAIAIAGGEAHVLAVRPDHSVVAWGYDWAGQTIVPPGLSNVVAVAGGLYHSLALKSDGTVVGWGDNSEGQSSPPSGLTGVVKIRACNTSSFAIKADGTVVSFGSIKAPVGLDHVVDIECGWEHALALKSDGTVVMFGDNSYGQLTPSRTLTNVKMIAASSYASIAVFGDGTMACWGSPDYDMTSIPAIPFAPKLLAAGYANAVVYCPDPLQIKLSKSSVYGGAPGALTGTISLSEASLEDHTFTLSTSDPTDTSVPSQLVVPAGATKVQFTIGHSIAPADRNVTISITDGTYTRSTSFILQAPRLQSFTTDALAVEGGQTIHGSLTMTTAFKSAVPVSLSVSNSAVSIPASVTIRAGATTGVFSIDFADVASSTAATITATLPGGAKTVQLRIKPKPAIKSFTLSSASILGNSTGTGTVTLKAPAGETGQTVTLTAGVGLAVPASIHFDPGQTLATFDIDTADVATVTTTSIAASTSFSVFNRNVTVKPMQMATAALVPASIGSGETTTLTVTLIGPVRAGTTVGVVIGTPAIASTSGTLVIPAGAQSGTLVLTGAHVTKTQATKVRATYNGVTKTQVLTVNP